jgi:hypothetical protein
MTDNENTKPTGVEDVVWDNIMSGFRMYCLCGYGTNADESLTWVAGDMEDHWTFASYHHWPPA